LALVALARVVGRAHSDSVRASVGDRSLQVCWYRRSGTDEIGSQQFEKLSGSQISADLPVASHIVAASEEVEGLAR
jgi:hypothetical protein